MRYSDLLADWLQDLGYTHCFFVAGGNIMHLLASISERFTCIPVVHEVTAGIASEYFNESSTKGRAFALVTAGPGLTNIVTAISGAWLESRELLVIGGQVKTEDLRRSALRQRGIQEINGVDIVKPITVQSVLMDHILDKAEFSRIVRAGSTDRKGPVFIEIPLDIQGRDVTPETLVIPATTSLNASLPEITCEQIAQLILDIRSATRPILLIGGGVRREVTHRLCDAFNRMGVPIMTTWNGADRISADHPLYFGRPNTWGQRYSNILLQQSDLLIALGTRLGMQQTGFNWQEFIPVGRIVQVDCDKSELEKGHPKVDVPLHGDANTVIEQLAAADLGDHHEWVGYCRMVKEELPLVDAINKTREGYVSPYLFVQKLSELCGNDDIVVPCSSGSAFTVMMQIFGQKRGQTIVTNKGLASMGYGLGGAIGAALAHLDRRVVLVEGDGGFSQNLQELGTVSINQLNLKIFIFDDNGYASIRMTQRNYFSGSYVGCDLKTGLGLPNWIKLFDAYDIPVICINSEFEMNDKFVEMFNQHGPAGFIVAVDPNQTYFPKITSRVTKDGGMESNPLHRMSPDIPDDLYRLVARYISDQ
ncbi:thiamine pyrophosphate-binding protein [Acidithiobacillus ferriphilus]|uniref:thiamine pyrophosphate-binding protein n=1 Tax=Acidithiobacillus ferriphilus TaxID=1689834 RepID=UPI00232D9DEB|nr:thiamine pyrophosphate-binding protein [Acidithiobacillus ferriphilus]WCE93912.1 thiamine pyrophosphate-binding protein [Acidithiobacillus ferriphilus]